MRFSDPVCYKKVILYQSYVVRPERSSEPLLDTTCHIAYITITTNYSLIRGLGRLLTKFLHNHSFKSRKQMEKPRKRSISLAHQTKLLPSCKPLLHRKYKLYWPEAQPYPSITNSKLIRSYPLPENATTTLLPRPAGFHKHPDATFQSIKPQLLASSPLLHLRCWLQGLGKAMVLILA